MITFEQISEAQEDLAALEQEHGGMEVLEELDVQPEGVVEAAKAITTLFNSLEGLDGIPYDALWMSAFTLGLYMGRKRT